MKKFLLCIAAICALAFTGCHHDDDDTKIWDFVNYSFNFLVTDNNGNNLLDPDFAGNILDNHITVTYKGKVYERLPMGGTTRENAPRELALRTERWDYLQSQPLLTFGEFSPTENYKDEHFKVDWGDGTTDNVAFDIYITWRGEEPTVHRTYYLNGEELYENQMSPIRIVKK
jgi:hypothetical protein